MNAVLMMKASNILSIIISELDHKNFDWIDEAFLKYAKYCWVTMYQFIYTILYFRKIVDLKNPETFKHLIFSTYDFDEKC